MIICLCHRVSERDIATAVRHGCASFDALQEELRVATGCGACAEYAREAFREAHCGQHARVAVIPAPALAASRQGLRTA